VVETVARPAGPVTFYRVNCGKCRYSMQVQASLLEWAKACIAKHALARHGAQTVFKEINENESQESPKAQEAKILDEQPTEGC